MKKKIVHYYTKANCPLCEEGLALLEDLANDFYLEIKLVDIYQNDDLLEKYQLMIPVVECGGEIVDCGQISWLKLHRYFSGQNK